MRIAIDYGILSLPSAYITRGIPRFTQRQLREVLRNDNENEYLLLCPSTCDVEQILPDIRSAQNVEIHHPPGRDPITSAQERAALLGLSEAFQDWIYRREIDIFHCTSPYIYFAPPLWQFDACPMVATLYDVIPLIYPDTYFADPSSKEQWLLAFTLLRNATRLLSISETTRSEAEPYLGVSPSVVDVVYPAPEPCFRPMSADAVRKALERLRKRIALPDGYALTVTFPAPSKNLTGLMKAYALLPERLRERMPLVITCAMGERDLANVMKLATFLGIEGDVVATGFVSDDELAALYNGATMVIHPSLYEGFGLPVVEAMACSTPVITTTTPTLMEISGDAALLVDPLDISGLAQSIESLASDAELRASLGDRGLANAARFSPDQLGRGTIDCYRRAVDVEPTSDPRPRVAVRMDVTTTESLRAFDLLSSRFDIEVFVADGRRPDPEVLHRSRMHDGKAFDRRRRQEPFALVVDHVVDGGNLKKMHTSTELGATVSLRVGPTSDGSVIPLGVTDPYGDHLALSVMRARAALGLVAEDFEIAVLSWPGGRDALGRLLLACSVLVDGASLSATILGASAEDRRHTLGLDTGNVRWMKSPTEAQIQDHLAAADLAVYLGPGDRLDARRFVLWALAAGSPLLLREDSAWESLPEELFVTVPAECSAEVLAARLADAASASDRRPRAALCRRYYDENATIPHMAERYRSLLHEQLSGIGPRR